MGRQTVRNPQGAFEEQTPSWKQRDAQDYPRTQEKKAWTKTEAGESGWTVLARLGVKLP